MLLIIVVAISKSGIEVALRVACCEGRAAKLRACEARVDRLTARERVPGLLLRLPLDQKMLLK